MKRNVITIALVAGALWAHAQSKPNIVFILADDQRHDELGCAGALVEKDDQLLLLRWLLAAGDEWFPESHRRNQK